MDASDRIRRRYQQERKELSRHVAPDPEEGAKNTEEAEAEEGSHEPEGEV